MFSELIDWQHTITDQIRLCGRKLREHKTRAIAKNDGIRQVNGLEMLRLSWCRRNADLLLAQQRVDCARLANIRVAHETDNELRRGVTRRIGKFLKYVSAPGQQEKKTWKVPVRAGALFANISSSSSTERIFDRGSWSSSSSAEKYASASPSSSDSEVVSVCFNVGPESEEVICSSWSSDSLSESLGPESEDSPASSASLRAFWIAATFAAE